MPIDLQKTRQNRPRRRLQLRRHIFSSTHPHPLPQACTFMPRRRRVEWCHRGDMNRSVGWSTSIDAHVMHKIATVDAVTVTNVVNRQ